MAIIAYLISAVLQYLVSWLQHDIPPARSSLLTCPQIKITFGFPKYKEMIFYRFDINTWQSCEF